MDIEQVEYSQTCYCTDDIDEDSSEIDQCKIGYIGSIAYRIDDSEVDLEECGNVSCSFWPWTRGDRSLIKKYDYKSKIYESYRCV